METLTQEQGMTPIAGFTVYDTVLMMHLIEKLLRGGGVTGRELSHVAMLRSKAISATQNAVGFDIEQLNIQTAPKTENQGG